MFRFFRCKNPRQGALQRFGLFEWWSSAFTEEQRARIIEKVGRKELLVDSNGLLANDTKAFLAIFIQHFETREYGDIAKIILEKQGELVRSSVRNVLALHFHLSKKIELRYKQRESDPSAISDTEHACREMIEISKDALREFKKAYGLPLPSHRGFRQLETILSKQGRYEEALKLNIQAEKEGWSDRSDRAKRRTGYIKKIESSKQ